jgi:5-deoxy-glucuronate isomerase
VNNVRRASADPESVMHITPKNADWDWSGLLVKDLVAGQRISVDIPDSEFLVLPLWGSAKVRTASAAFELSGRNSVFAGPSDFVYVGLDDSAEVEALTDGRFAFPSSVAKNHLPSRYQSADKVSVEMRGAGNSSRQVNNFCTPGEFEADRLIACEVLTPAGNWSSFPPHKHDEEGPTESALEEIYYYEIADSPSGAPGRGFQRVYGTAERPIEVLAEVCSGDAVVIPHGWHGPSIAMPGYDMYYLNVMAGPGTERTWKICDDPAHAWIRQTWTTQVIDPRLPFGSDRPTQ